MSLLGREVSVFGREVSLLGREVSLRHLAPIKPDPSWRRSNDDPPDVPYRGY